MTLFFVRHGKTLWTEEKRFTGWGHTKLSQRGLAEAASAAKILKRSGQSFDLCFTSSLMRAQQTADIIGHALDMPQGFVQTDWRLNERHYGALQGELRQDMIEAHGEDDILQWRKNFRAIPPALDEDDPRWREQLERLSDIPAKLHPKTESMFQAAARTMAFWTEKIEPALRSEKDILIIAHTNSIRAMIAHLEGYNEAQSAEFRFSTAVPRRYDLDAALAPERVRDLTKNPKVMLRHMMKRRKLKQMGRV